MRHKPDLHSHNLSSRKARTPEAPQRKSPANNNNKISQIQKSEWGEKKHNPTAIRRNEHHGCELDLTPCGPSSKPAISPLVCEELLNFGCLAEQALPNQSLFSLTEVQTGLLCEASESSFQNLVLRPSSPQYQYYICYWLLPLFLPSA